MVGSKYSRAVKKFGDRARAWTQPHLDALEAFNKRKERGMNLSDRVWRLTNQFKSEMELALELGLGEGKSAAALSRDVRQYLNEPHRLFRRVRDEKGQLRLSKAAAAYHPGQGVYRSSYKNALRLTATENNMAYRTADHERWNDLDFVIGIEIKLSGNHPIEDICDEMCGVYPKTFKFVGWHPFCRCYAVPKLADEDEFIARQQALIDGEELPQGTYTGEVTEMPQCFTNWVQENADRIETAKSEPYFIKDNRSLFKTTPEEWGQRPSEFNTTREWREYIHKDEQTYEQAIIDNFRELESKLKCRRGSTMSFEEADNSMPNPNYKSKTANYSENCQCCSVTFEMRRRGFNVTAQPLTETSQKELMKYAPGAERDSHKTIPQLLAARANRTLAFLDPKTMQRPTEQLAGGLTTAGGIKQRKKALIEADELTKSPGRYQISFAYRNSGGHRMCAERHADGTLTIYDPQSGDKYQAKDGASSIEAWESWSNYYDFQAKIGIGILRVDNLIINPEYISGICKAKRTRRFK